MTPAASALALADDHELLRVLIGRRPAASARGRPVAQLLEESGDGLAALGLSSRASFRVLAAAELARRHQPAAEPAEPVTGPRQALGAFATIRVAAEEVLAVLLLDARLRPVGPVQAVAHGSVARVGATPREVFGPALAAGACALVLAHNHPSGDPEPSPEDHRFTASMREAGRVLEVEVVDHLVLARRAYFSFREAGAL